MLTAIFQVLGGLALFLLAMEMMTDGLKNAAGHHLRHLLGHWTRTPIRGLLAGFVITGIVQHSGAVTVATIGFVNAGLLNLSQSLAVVFGSNIGTTVTGWLVSLIGFGFKIEAMALPLLAAGVATKLISRNPRNRFLGEALAGFALFFLGLSILKSALESSALGFQDGNLLSAGYGLPTFMLIGLLATVLTQSSSAALAIVLTAAASGLIALDSAAAAVIGANLGSTSTAALSALKATANARRLAIGHILFNLVTGLVALMILPAMLWLVASLARWLELDANAALSLALFHTLFNLLGAAIMLPFIRPFARHLGKLFRSKEEDSARPKYLDNTLLKAPELAIGAVDQEMRRLMGHSRGLLRVSLDREGLEADDIQPKADGIRSLNSAITEYIGQLRAEEMHPSVVGALAVSIRTCRYLTEATDLAAPLIQLRALSRRADCQPMAPAFGTYFETLRRLVSSEAPSPELGQAAEEIYHQLKEQALQAMVTGELSTELGDRLLNALSAVRRLTDQWNKALQWQAGMAILNHPEAQPAEC